MNKAIHDEAKYCQKSILGPFCYRRTLNDDTGSLNGIGWLYYSMQSEVKRSSSQPDQIWSKKALMASRQVLSSLTLFNACQTCWGLDCECVSIESVTYGCVPLSLRTNSAVSVAIKLEIDFSFTAGHVILLTEPGRDEAKQEVKVSSNQSCYEAMKLCLDNFVAADRKLLQCLNSYCR